MSRHIRKVYIVHHSHTDVGYTDLQEQVIYNQVENIRSVVRLLKYCGTDRPAEMRTVGRENLQEVQPIGLQENCQKKYAGERPAVELRNAVLCGAVFKDCAGDGEGGLFSGW